MNNFYFNNHWLSQFGGRILDLPQYEIAMRDFDTVIIPGQSAEVLQENDRYQNVNFSRKIAFLPFINGLSAKQLSNSIINWFVNSPGYQVYRDSYNPGYFTKAFIKNVDAIVRELPSLLTTTIEFSRCAYWYSDSGQKEKLLPLNTVVKLINNENTIANPIIKIKKGSSQTSSTAGRLKVNGTIITLYCPLDCDYAILNGENLQYWGYKTDGTKVFVSEILPPPLIIGENIIELTASKGSEISVVPNWRRL